MKKTLLLFITIVFAHVNTWAGEPPPPAISGPSQVVITSSDIGPVTASFSLDVRNDYANYHDGFSHTNWGWNYGGFLSKSDKYLTLDMNVPPLNFSGGSVKVSATSHFNDGTSHTANFLCNVYVINNGPGGSIISLEEKTESSKKTAPVLLHYPNPTNGIMNVSINLEREATVKIHVLDMAGKSVYKETTKTDISGMLSTRLDLVNLERGIYMLKVESQDDMVSQRIVIE